MPTMTLVAPAVFLLLGLLLYAFCSAAPPQAKLAEIGMVLFKVGAFWLCCTLLGRVVHFG